MQEVLEVNEPRPHNARCRKWHTECRLDQIARGTKRRRLVERVQFPPAKRLKLRPGLSPPFDVRSLGLTIRATHAAMLNIHRRLPLPVTNDERPGPLECGSGGTADALASGSRVAIGWLCGAS